MSVIGGDRSEIPIAELYHMPDKGVRSENNLKPGEIELTMQEVEECAGQYKPRMLQNNQVFEL